MSSISSSRQRYHSKYREICVSNIGQTEPNTLLTYFQKYGNIVHYNFTSSTGGFVFITYEEQSMVDECMKNRPHNLDGRTLYVKRALPIDDEHPRERFDTTYDLMIVTDIKDRQFLTEIREYLSFYGKIYACKYCHEYNFNYILVEFGDKDEVDRIILDKPHHYHEHLLDVMKFIPSNIELMNKKYSSNKRQTTIVKDAIDDNNHEFIKSSKSINKREPINEMDLEKEVYRLQNYLKKMNEDFALQQRRLEDDCCEQLKILNENVDKTHRLQQDLEQEYATLSTKYESIKHENDILNEQYLTTELENFEITSYYEQILAEEKAKTLQLEIEYNRKLKSSNVNSSSPKSQSQSSKSC
jgi:hypothetical protein